MLVGAAILLLSIPPSWTQAFYFINRPPGTNILNPSVHICTQVMILRNSFNNNKKKNLSIKEATNKLIKLKGKLNSINLTQVINASIQNQLSFAIKLWFLNIAFNNKKISFNKLSNKQSSLNSRELFAIKLWFLKISFNNKPS